MGLLRDALQLKGGGIISLVGAGGKTSLMYRLAQELSGDGDAVLTTTTTRIYRPDPAQSKQVIIANAFEEIQKQAVVLLKKDRHLTAASGLTADQGKLTGFPPDVVDALYKSGLFGWIIVEADGAARRPLKAPATHEPVLPSCTGWLIGMIGLGALGKPCTDQWVHRQELLSGISGLSPGATITPAALACLIKHPQGILKGAPKGCRQLIFLNQADEPGGLSAGKDIAELLRREGHAGVQRVIIGQALAEPPVLEVYDLESR